MFKNYWSLDNKKLEKLAKKYNIEGYLDNEAGITGINRERIVNQLTARDRARFANIAFIAMLASLTLTALNVWITFYR